MLWDRSFRRNDWRGKFEGWDDWTSVWEAQNLYIIKHFSNVCSARPFQLLQYQGCICNSIAIQPRTVMQVIGATACSRQAQRRPLSQPHVEHLMQTLCHVPQRSLSNDSRPCISTRISSHLHHQIPELWEDRWVGEFPCVRLLSSSCCGTLGDLGCSMVMKTLWSKSSR